MIEHATASCICTLHADVASPWRDMILPSRYRMKTLSLIREYGSTLYVGMTREKNGGRIKRVH